MRRQWLAGRDANRMIMEGREQYRRYLDLKHRRAKRRQAIRDKEDMFGPDALSENERAILAEEVS